MNDTTLTTGNGLEQLAERIEKAAAHLQQLRAERDRLLGERDGLLDRVRELEQRLAGSDPTALRQELAALRAQQQEWSDERRAIATRVEGLIRKLDRLETQ